MSLERPKPLCPVANVPLVDFAIASVAEAVDEVAVNICHGRAVMLDHLRSHGVHCAVEPIARGTAGALAGLRRWLDGRAALVVNGDTWCPADLASFAAGWDGRSVRVLILGDEPFGPRSRIVASITPWSEIVGLPAHPSGLWEQVWRAHLAAGAVDVVAHHGPFVDCATPSDYLEANLTALRSAVGPDVGGSLTAADARLADSAILSASVIGAGAAIAGQVVESVIWPGASVGRHERLYRCVRTTEGTTVLVR